MVTRKRVVLGVSGGIAAYKACSLLRLFTESGHDVTVVPTAAALNFVGTATWAALSGNPVSTEVWTDVHQVPHVRLGQHADLVVVAPATADLMAKAAHGLADDLLTNTLLTARCPVVLAPAMHTEMWEHPATVANVATLRSRGVHVIDPASGRLTGADTGLGRLPEPQDIFAVCRELLSRSDGSVPASPPAAGTLPSLRDRSSRHTAKMSWGSGSLPRPVSAPVRRPEAGSITCTPRDRRVATLATVAGCSHISVCIAGASTTGQRAVSRVLVSRSSASPCAALAIRSAVAGATTTRSACWPRRTCGTW